MQKDAITIQILGGNTPKLTQHRTQISTMLNKEITTVQIDPSAPPVLLFKDKKLPSILIFLLDHFTIDALNQLTALPAAIRPALLAPYVRIVVVFFEIDNWGRNGHNYATLS